ncbi:glycosyltransferase [Synechococcales cyanobacterium C]|uniref:Glycosyltransferase n=1 Tax=Petrachloros mirabilis ULC683 TaxID=2781853 RepID=A0A8K1ZZA5_9CYAN|nr:glycosyltransferase [Petrachloros mirabilis]NCJ07578.1 glycosyltransferase [Petrachloros mirabilis ULC683]
MKLKICLTTLEFPPDVGGVGESVARIAQMLITLGFEVHVAVFRAVFRDEKADAEQGIYRRASRQTSTSHGVTVHRLKPAVRSPLAKDQDYLCDLYDQLASLHAQYHFDLFHAFFINEMGFLTTLLAQEQGLPVINSIRGADLQKHLFSPQQHGQITWTLANSDWATFVSQDLLHRARVLVPSLGTKSSSFWNSIAPIDFEALPPPLLLDQLRGTVIGASGNFRDKKGLEYLIDACNTLKSETHLTLLLVGDFVEKERHYWEQELEASGLKSQLVITGQVSRTEALAYLPHMDIFAIPSIHDGCPNTLLEAMLAARAIVGTTVDAIGEILAHEKDALLVPPASSAALTVALRRLIEQPNLRQQLGMAARQKVLRQLAPDVEQQQWQKIYQTVLARWPIQVSL